MGPSEPIVPFRAEQAQDIHDRADANARFNLPSFRVEEPSPDKGKSDSKRDGVGGCHHATDLSESRPTRPVRLSSVPSSSGPDFDGDVDVSLPCRCRCYCWITEMGDRGQTTPSGGKRRQVGMVADSVGMRRAGSRVHLFDGASSMVGGFGARVCTGDGHWTSDRLGMDTVDAEKKHKRDDPAAEPRHRGVCADMQNQTCKNGARTGRRRAWSKMGRFCRERVCKKIFSWRDHIVGRAGGLVASMGGPDSRSAPEEWVSGDDSVVARTSPRAFAPLVGATGSGPVKDTDTKTRTRTKVAMVTTAEANSADTEPELSRRNRLTKGTHPRPKSATTQWLAEPISTSTMGMRSLPGRRPRV
ncbi:hypothetical protein EV363DRAFT_1165545 [Boletus edulis]|nr:hypothetical protein EV363DRAFT_1165545 [Boletus edulis]